MVEAMEKFFADLPQQLTRDAVILTTVHSNVAAAHERWTNIDHEISAVIVQPAIEDDITVLVSQPSWRLL